jgi:hypothetical protein
MSYPVPPQTPPGWYPVATGGRGYWDGRSWMRISPEDRAAILDQVIARELANGMRTVRVETRSPYQAVLVYGTNPNHILHLLIALFTCGLWFIVWLFIAATSAETRWTYTIDPFGKVVRI